MSASLSLALGAILLASSPSSASAAQAARRVDSAAIRALADRVPERAQLARANASEKARALAPCADVTTGLYCVGLGFVETQPDYDKLLTDSNYGQYMPTGDRPFAKWVNERAALSTAALRKEVEAELETAVAGLDKAAAVAYAVEAAGRGEEVGSIDSLAAAQASGDAEQSRRACTGTLIMDGKTEQQNQSNWCGPTTFQMMEWARSGSKETQSYWAGQLGTTSSGTSISSMVSLTNSATTWDNAAGTYIVQSVSSWDANQFYGVHVSHLGDGTPAPIIEHPELLTTYFSYLTVNGDGHFQPGRGYQSCDGTQSIFFFEPWSENKFYGNGNYTWGAHSISPAKYLSATKANSFQNIGL
jgi:hypothetical protein